MSTSVDAKEYLGIIKHEPCSFVIPDIDPDTPLVCRQVSGIKDRKKHNIGVYSNRNRLYYKWARDWIVPSRYNPIYAWNHFLTIDGSGWFNILYYINNARYIKVIIDGEREYHFHNPSTSSKRILVWGDHALGMREANVGEWYFYNGGQFDEDSIEYRSNFLRGGVRFKHSLEIYYYQTSRSYRTMPLGVEYILEQEWK